MHLILKENYSKPISTHVRIILINILNETVSAANVYSIIKHNHLLNLRNIYTCNAEDSQMAMRDFDQLFTDQSSR